ncbi:MAG: signal peptidase I [bacterium]|nr:signal peptidase I [bacterium]MDZ4299903.1 signal peptidase I [Candidatus Sungbacteria bacterium]
MDTKKIAITSYYVFVSVLGIVGVLVVVSAFPITGNFKIMAVLSGSMEPAIRTGSIVVVRPSTSYSIGNIVTFTGTSGGKSIPITHRVMEIRVDRGVPSYITKGDANNAPDARLVAHREIIGGLVFSVPYLGYGVETARKPYGLAALILLPAALIIIDQAGRIKKELARLRREKEEKTI